MFVDVKMYVLDLEFGGFCFRSKAAEKYNYVGPPTEDGAGKVNVSVCLSVCRCVGQRSKSLI